MIGRTYLRKSRGEESDPAVLAAHRSILARCAEADNVPISPEHVIEEIGSADTLADRPRFRALLAELQALPRPVALYCMEIDRLTRGPLPDRAAVYAALLAAGVLIRTPSRWYDLANPDDELLFELKALFARQENAFHHRRVKDKWDEMTRKGVVLTGVAPTGYEWDKNIRNFVEEPIGAALVRALFAAATDHSTYALGKQFGLRASSILRILRNPVYTGYPARHCVHRRDPQTQKKTGTRYLKRDQWTWPEQQGTYAPLVSREQFDRVQAALKARYRLGEKTGTTEGWCRDILEFEEVPGRIDLGSHGRSGQSRYLVYQVKGQKRLYIAREIVHREAAEAIRRALIAPGLAAAAADAKRAAEAAPRPAASERDPVIVRAELDQCRGQLDELLTRELSTGDAEERASIGRVRATLRDRVGVLTRELRSSQPQPVSPTALLRLLDEFPEFIESGPVGWERAGEIQKRLLTNALLARMVVHITPQPHPVPYLREIALIEYRAWLKPILK